MQIKQIQFLRFFAAYAIFIFHFGREVQVLEWGSRLWDVSNAAVSFFFFLSGFVLTYVYNNRGINHKRYFYFVRFARIYPLYALALFLIILPAVYENNISVTDLILSILMLQAWVPGHSQVLNTPAWAISVQLLFYILFPFLLDPLRKIKTNRRIIVILFALWGVNLVVFVFLLNLSEWIEMNNSFKDFIFYHPLVHLPTFIIGCLSAILYIREKEVFSRFAWLLVTSSIILFLLFVYIPNPIIRYHHNGLFCPLYFMIVVGLSACDNNPISKLFGNSLLVLLGNLSYAIYIMQKPFWHFWFWLLENFNINLSTDQLFGLFSLFLIVISWIIYFYVENPIYRNLKEIAIIK